MKTDLFYILQNSPHWLLYIVFSVLATVLFSFLKSFFGWVRSHSWTSSKSLLSFPNKTNHLGLYLDCKVDGEGGHNLDSWWFPWFFGQCEASHYPDGRKSYFPSFPLGTDLILYFSQQNVDIIFCIDGLAFLKEIKHFSTVNIRWVDWCSRPTVMRRVLHTLCEGFIIFELSSSGETCFSKLFFKTLKNFLWLDPLSAVRNLMIMRCSMLTDTFSSLISLVELRQDWTSSQKVGEGRNFPFQGQ